MKTPSRFDCATALTTAAALFFAPLATYAGDVAGAPQVAAGAVTFGQNGNVRTINQTSGAAIINWQDFSINAGDLTRFLQPGANSAVLNRVLGFSPSLLNGQLQANGSVYLINPNGVIVGPQGRVDVGAFYASTLNVADDEFLKAGGALRFAGDSRAGVQNLGTINATDGDVMLIAYTVRNGGTINAAKGVAGLAAGSEVLLTHQGDQRIAVKSGLSAGGLEIGVENSGLVQAAQAELKAAGGSIYSLAVNQTGVVRATGVENKNGRVLLTADAGDVNVAGAIAAHNADGSGGQIFIGGGFQGKNTDVANAARTTVSASAKLDASASSATGSGGQIVVWADQTTQFAGSIAARGGSAGGDGGSLEVSGKHSLDFTGTADTSAPAGKKGRLLLDPDAVIISTATDQNLAVQGGFIEGTAVPSFLNNGTLNALLATTDVIVQAGDTNNPPGFNGISVNADVGWSAATTLTLTSRDTIAINANINGGSTGNLTLQPGTFSVTDGTTGAITLASNKGITVDTLSLDRSFIGSTNSNSVGAINLAGTVTATTVELVRNFGDGVTGDILINNPANQIGTLRGTGSVGGIAGNLRVTDSAGGLIVDGDLSGVSGAVEIVTTGSLTVNSGALVKNTGASDLVLAANSGSFVNNAGASAIDASGAGRYLIYSDSPTNTTKDGLTGLSVYNKTYAGNAPASITQTGDRFIFSLAPTLTFTADNLSKSAGAANPSLTYAVTGLQTGDTLADAITGTPALSTTAVTGSPGGSYPISVANGTLALTNMGYGLSLQAGALTVIANLLTISANSTSKTYGQVNPTFTATASDPSVVVTGLQFSTTAATSSGVGSYAITPFGATASGYTINFVPGTLTINPASLTISANSLSKTYGAANPAFTASYSGFVNGDTSSVVSGLSFSTSATTSSGVGSYAVTPTGATASNYSITLTPGSLSVNPASLRITADSANKTYGSDNPAFTASFSGLVNGDSPSVVNGLSLTTDATVASPVGGYRINASSGSAANYNVSFDSGTLSVQPAMLTVTPDRATRLYGDANPTFSGAISGFVNGDNTSVLTATPIYFSSASLTSNVGDYPITASGAAASNYNFNYASGTLTVNPAVLSVRADNLTRVYGDANPTATYSVSGLKNGDTADGKFFIFTLGNTSPANAPIGSYPILFSGNDTPNDNYSTVFVNGTMSVTPRPLTIRPDDIARIYGAANPTFTATYAGLASFDSPSAISNLKLSTIATSASNAGSYLIAATGGVSSNYAITYAPGTLTVNKAPLTVAIDDATRTYGVINPVFTAHYTGFVNGDDASKLGAGLASTATESSSTGVYPITLSGTATNYTITQTAGHLVVNAAPLDVTVATFNLTYGETHVASIPIVAQGLRLNDTTSVVAVISDTTAQSPVGTYPLFATSISPNYTIRSFSSPGMQIVPRPITITFDNLTRVYGDANPTLSYKIGGSGLASFDTVAAILGATPGTTTATATSNAGGYPITLSAISNPNYAFTVQSGALTITPRPVTFTVDSFRINGGDPLPKFTLQATGLPSGVTVAQAFPNLQFTTTPFTSGVSFDSGVTTLFPEVSLDPNTTVVSSLINPMSYLSSSNYNVTHVAPGVLTTTTRLATTELTTSTATSSLAASVANTKLTVGTGDAALQLPAPFRGPAAEPYLEQAAQDLMQRIISSGDKATLDKYFKDGVAGFLSGLDTDPTKQAMLMGALSTVVLKYAKLPADQQPPALAGIIHATLANAQQVKIDEAKDVVQRYNDWMKGPDPSIPQIVNPGDMNLVPNFDHQVKVDYAKDAAIVVTTSLTAGAAAGGVMTALPVGMITSAVGVGAETSLIEAATMSLIGAGATGELGADAVLAGVAGPALVAVLATATVVVAGVELSQQPKIKAAIAADQVLAETPRDKVTVNLNDPDDLDAFNNAFTKLMLGGGGF